MTSVPRTDATRAGATKSVAEVTSEAAETNDEEVRVSKTAGKVDREVREGPTSEAPSRSSET